MDPRERIVELEAALAAKDARIAELERLVAQLMAQVATLTGQVEVLTEKLGRNSSNSHLPPSSDPPGRPRSGTERKKSKSKQHGKRKRGGQRGHPGVRRVLLPEDQVDKVENLFPEQCENCWQRLPEVVDGRAKRYQLIEVPPLRPHTTEYRRHAVACTRCGHKTRAPYDEARIPSSPFGPRLMSLVALLTGVYHVSRRKTVTLLSDLVGVEISLGAVSTLEARVSEAVKPAVDEVCEQIERAEVKHTDGTSWLQAGVALSLWTLATSAATFFKIVADGSRATLRPLFGALQGILVSDRARHWASGPCNGGRSAGPTCSENSSRSPSARPPLARSAASYWTTPASCSSTGRTTRLASWTGARSGPGWPRCERRWKRCSPGPSRPTSNGSRAPAPIFWPTRTRCGPSWSATTSSRPTTTPNERELRAFVLWRKRSFGTQSQRGNLFAERLMTIAHTARKQGKDVLAFLTACCRARQANTAIPSLFDAGDVQAARAEQ